jgi:hypothetical protein
MNDMVPSVEWEKEMGYEMILDALTCFLRLEGEGKRGSVF